MKKKVKAAPIKKVTTSSWQAKELSEEELFANAMGGVVPLDENRQHEITELPDARTYPSDEEKVQEALEALIRGEGNFDLNYNDEHVEGSILGIDPHLLRKLRQGELSWQAHLDLHGFHVEEARELLQRFIHDQHRRGHRCLLLVHGRGLHSPEKEPVIKPSLIRWLTRGFLRKIVLAFVSARPHDGGAGALYVLLRQRPR